MAAIATPIALVIRMRGAGKFYKRALSSAASPELGLVVVIVVVVTD